MTKISKSRKIFTTTAVGLVIFAVGAPVAFAQVAEVVVTARKREENVQNIPVAVTAVSGKQLEKFNITNVEDVAQATPQLIIARGSSGSGADISLRGIGTPTENIGIEQSVSVNIDGVYYGQGRVIDEGTFDVGSVQVLKGPQALFYGKNATAGALAITTNDPTSAYAAGLTAGYEFTTQNPYVEGYASGPVTDKFGLRFAFRYSDQEQGYIKNTAYATTYNTFDIATGMAHSSPVAAPPAYLGQDKDLLLRLTAKWEPINNFTITAKATYDQHHSNNNVDNAVVVYCPEGHPQSEINAGLTRLSSCGHTFTESEPQLPAAIAGVPHSLESLAGGRDFERYQDTTEYLKFNYSGANYTLTSTNAFQHMFNDWADNQAFTAAPSVYAGEHFVWNQFSTEERGITSFQFPINFAGGVYFQTTHLQFAQDVDFLGAQNSAAPLPTDEFVAYNKRAATTGHTYAVFGQAIWDIVKNVQLTAGARYTHEIKSSYFYQPYVWPAVSFLFNQYNPADPANTAIGAHQVFDNWSPEVTLTWKPVSDVTLYAAYKTGYKSGGFSDSAILSNLIPASAQAPDFQFKPETAKGFEFGEKAILLDHQLRLNVDVFDYQYSNVQVDFFNTPTFDYITLNAASARTYGVEFEGEYAPLALPGLTLHLDGAYDVAHYEKFLAPCTPAGLTYEQGCNIQRNVSASGVESFTSDCGNGGTPALACNFMDVSGRPTALAPKWTAVIGGDYTRPVSSKLKMDIAMNVRVSSSYLTNSFPSNVVEKYDRQSAYGMLDAVVSLGGIDNRWTLSLIGRNLTNAFVQTSTGGLPLSGGTSGCKVAVCGSQLISDQLSTVLNPRTIALQLKVAY